MTDSIPSIDQPKVLDDAPCYDKVGRSMRESRTPQAEQFAQQILRTTTPFLETETASLTVLDVGCGYGATSMALANNCHHVVGIDPSESLITEARQEAQSKGKSNLEYFRADIATWNSNQQFDLIVLDNVFEHLPDQRKSLQNIVRLLKPGGVCYLLMPNKLWPIEVHYHLPFLSWLPLSMANRYLKWTGKGTNYTDASYAPTYGSLKRMLSEVPGTEHQFVLPADLNLTMSGKTWAYQLGTRLIQTNALFWWISKAFLVVLKKTEK